MEKPGLCHEDNFFLRFVESVSPVGTVLGESHGSGLGMGWSGLVESVGLAEGKSVKTAHPSQIHDQGLFWAFLPVIGID